jgi:signal transduction histidine kinase
VGEVRRLCHGLYPPTLESLGLVAAFQQLIRSCGDSAAKIELSYDEALAGRRFQGEIEITLFRIAQEAINNAMRHSPGAAIGVSLQTRADGSLCLRICDDGAGFDTAASAAGLGLLSMKERALSVGGVLTVSSKPDGTCVQAAVPAREPAPSELATGPEGG